MKKEELNWDLKDLLNQKEFDKEIEKVKKEQEKFLAQMKKISPGISPGQFKKIILEFEKIIINSSRVLDFASLYWATHLNNDETLYYQGKSKELELKFDEIQLTFSRWLMGVKIDEMKKLDQKNAQRLFKSLPDRSFYFESLLEGKKYILPMGEERIISRKTNNMRNALLQIYRSITDGFEYEMLIKGKKQPKKINTMAELTIYIRSSEASERKGAYQALFKPYKENISKLFNIYQAIARDWDDGVYLRNYEEPISIRNFRNSVEDKTIKTLMDVCTENRTIFHEYFLYKAKEIKLKKLARYDIYAPVGKKVPKFSFEDSKNLIFDIFKNFSPGFYNGAKNIFDNKHVDSHPRPNKRSGAFCSTTSPGILPYILLNFNGTSAAMMTTAHELGHGIHSQYANRNPMLVYSEPLPLAETASTLSETLVFDRLLGEIKNKEEKKTLLFEKLDASFASILRQNYFVKFEIVAHDKIQKGVTPEGLSDAYFELLVEQFGNSVILSEEFRYEWLYIPHIFNTPFYCYAYNFGELLSLSLYSIYKENGKSFIPKIERILSAGGSVKPSVLLAEIGIDINSKDFWLGSFKLIRDWLEILKKL